MKIIENVDLPLELIEAQETGKLVLFVGAGASISPPAGLMGFHELAKKLGDDAQATLPSEAEPLDQYLGALASNEFDVHRHARAALNRADSQPNDTHKAIVDLALSSKCPRIITTNFDVLLGEACKVRGVELQRWVGPALPLGDDFSGIVQIHGALDSYEHQMVLTDADFGQAYVTRSWASRFLTEVFSHFTVLFIGYSHRDPIMRYFSHGLPRNTSRFALLGHGNESDFQDSERLMEGFGIKVIEYPSSNQHEALPRALSEWARLSRLDKLGVRKEIEEILVNFDNATPVEKDYLSRQVNTNDGIRNFSSIAWKLVDSKQDSVYQWVREFDVFKQLFERTTIKIKFSEDSLSSLAEWAARYFTRDSETNYEFWRCHWEFGTLLREEFARFLLSYASEISQDGLAGNRRLVTYLRTSVPGLSAPLVADNRWLNEYEWSMFTEPEFSRLVEARVVVDSFTFKLPKLARKQISFIPQWNLDYHQLATGLSRMKMNSDLSMSTITRILANSIYRIHALLNALNSEEHRDVLSSYRPTIRESDHVYFDIPLNPIVDFIVDFARTHGAAQLPMEEWLDSGVILLERIAIHIVSFAQEFSASEKLGRLMDRQQLIISNTCFPEIRELLMQVMDETTESERNELLSVLRAEFESDIDRYKAYGIYKVLLTILEKCELWEDAENFKSEIEQGFSEFKNLTLSESEDFQSTEDLSYSAILVDNLEQDRDINDVLSEFLLSVRKDPFHASQVIRIESEAMALHSPKDAIDMAQAAADLMQDRFTEEFISSVLSSIDGKSYGELTNELKMLSDSVDGNFSLTALARAIQRASNVELTLTKVQDLEDAIDNIWARNRHEFNREFQIDLRFASHLNQWPGILVTAAGRLVYARWKDNKEEWSGIPKGSRERLKSFLDEEGLASPVIAEAFIVSLRFFLSADREFANENLVLLFKKNKLTRLGAWVGYLSRPFYAAEYPVAGMILDLLGDGWKFISEHQEHSELSKSFFDLIATIIREGTYPSETIVRLLLDSVSYLPEPIMIAFYEHISRILKGKNGQKIWRNGVKEFIQARVDGKPKELQPAERTSLYELPFIAINLAIDLFSVIGDTSSLPLENVLYHSNLVEAPEAAQKSIVDAYISRLSTNGIEPKKATAWKHHLENPLGDKEISSEVARLISKLDEFA